jgi:hypothetical protein
MPTVDLDADLIPGLSAGGWRIGDRLSDCTELLVVATNIEYQPEFHLAEAISRNTGVLIVRNYFPLDSGHTAVFFGAVVVRLVFNARGELFEVSVGEGYRGLAFGRIGIGSSVEEVRSLFPVFYDGGDEMYYPDHELFPGAPSGIAFYASEEEQPEGTPILAISVHDWDVMRRSPVGQSEAESVWPPEA